MAQHRLDRIDMKILAVLQDEGRISNVELARRVGLSPPPCLRRVKALEKGGIIRSYRAVLDAKALGFGVTAFAMVGLENQAEADLKRFQERVTSWPIVRECHMLSGDIDFILKCVSPDLETFQRFVTDELTPAPGVAHVRTALAIRPTKQCADLPLAAEG